MEPCTVMRNHRPLSRLRAVFAGIFLGIGCAAHAQDQPPATPREMTAPDLGPVLKPNPLDLLRNFEPAEDEEYRLGKGDEIVIDFPGRPEMQAKLTIGPDGRITLPLAGDLTMAGLTRNEAAHAVTNALDKYYAHLEAQITVSKYTANRVIVLGDVEHPGVINFDGTPTLLEALTRSGFITDPKKSPRIPERCAVYRGREQVVWVNLKSLVEAGNPLADLRLHRDDVVYVPSGSEQFVSVLGEVQHPGAIQLTSASTLPSVLAEAGGFTEKAGNTPRIQIVDPKSGTSRLLSSRDLVNPAKTLEISLHPGDIVFVPQSGFARATYYLQRLNPLFQLSTLSYLAGNL